MNMPTLVYLLLLVTAVVLILLLVLGVIDVDTADAMWKSSR